MAQRNQLSKIIDCMHNSATFEVALKQVKVKQSTLLCSLKTLISFLDHDNVLYVKGRLNYATDLSDEAKHPALLPKDHDVTKIFILDQHQKLAHQSAEWVLVFLNSNIEVRLIREIKTVRFYLLNRSYRKCFTEKAQSN